MVAIRYMWQSAWIKCKAQIQFQGQYRKKKLKYLSFLNLWIISEMMLLLVYWIKYIILKLISPAVFYFRMWFLEHFRLHFRLTLFIFWAAKLLCRFQEHFISWAPSSLLFCPTCSWCVSIPEFWSLSLLLHELSILSLASVPCTAILIVHPIFLFPSITVLSCSLFSALKL